MAKINRFSGRTPQPWPVASHSVLVERLVAPELGPWALLHDAHEVFLGDLTMPAVELICKGFDGGMVEEAIREAKGRLDRMIAAAWHLPVRSLMALRKRDKDDIAEEASILDMYCAALGMA
ncbi:DUF2312 domain-containing protein [Paracoccus cavernae]|uniref:DUF2312 domain-containing protein n=2 Tax=Paracoccus cavernae TaxID=1571207 RepID=A0ABT8D5C0_9RHOB|nr:DUF2312 domain-containing protein [Paracoccus cavernae]